MLTDKAREFEICVSSALQNLSQIGDFVAERARLSGMDENRVFDVQMAVDEACSNTIQHGYEGRDDGQIQICCFVEDSEFVVRITDQGLPFDPGDVSTPNVLGPIEDREVGGLGLFFIRELMDEVAFRTDPDSGNELVMRKRRSSDQPRSTPG